MTTYQGFLREHSRSPDAVVAAVADNCRFDERAGTGRWQQFELLLSATAGDGAIGWDDWIETNRLHFQRYCAVARPDVPDAFLDSNQSAWLPDMSEDQSLVRIEAITHPLWTSDLDLDRLDGLLQRAGTGDVDARQTVQSFLDAWNQRRDARPTFAAFYNDVKQEADDHDWPHALRDRLGLGSYGSSGGAPFPVALMCYSVADVLSAQTSDGSRVACAVPTVFDGGMNEFFFPVPERSRYGATMHLLPEQAGTTTAEIVHCRIDYKREHLWKIGEITQPRQLTGSKLRCVRDRHLIALQNTCARRDFGEFMVGRK